MVVQRRGMGFVGAALGTIMKGQNVYVFCVGTFWPSVGGGLLVELRKPEAIRYTLKQETVSSKSPLVLSTGNQLDDLG